MYQTLQYLSSTGILSVIGLSLDDWTDFESHKAEMTAASTARADVKVIRCPDLQLVNLTIFFGFFIQRLKRCGHLLPLQESHVHGLLEVAEQEHMVRLRGLTQRAADQAAADARFKELQHLEEVF